MKELNIAAILKDKPQGTKLYNWLYNIDVELDTISTTDTETVVWCTNETDNNTTCHRGYSEFGTERCYPDGLQILFPSKKMRDWRKFSWKKGDVLTDNISTICMFEGWANSDYTEFKAKYTLHLIASTNAENEVCKTNNFVQVLKEEDQQSYLATAETYFNVNITKGSLQIEKTQPEFKDGDIAFADYGNRQDVFIVSGKTNLSEGYNSFIALDLRGLTLDMGCRMSFFKKDLCNLRPATDEERQRLFDALAKENKKWDAEQKAIVDLKPKVELKPFDKVLIRGFKDQAWQVSLFGYKDANNYYCCNGSCWNQCIPYEGNESLLGTTKDVEG